MSRYFFALWPDFEVRNQLEAISQQLPDRCGRRVKTENLHITLVFLGNVETAVMTRICRDVDGISSQETELTLDEYGWWKKPQVIWLGTGSMPAGLAELAMQLNTIVRDNGVQTETRPFVPHLTLVRKVKRPLTRFLFPPIHWKIRDFCLVESITHASGAEYKPCQNWNLTST